VSITFNPDRGRRQHEEVRRLHPGHPRRATHRRVPPLRPDADHGPGAIYLALISLIPLIAFVLQCANQNFPFGGTSILIIVGVGLETVKQIEASCSSATTKGSSGDG
jgi:preprotein translocase subunit SecY